ncbi:aromatic ring-opening dioxygenase LigA [Burkholderia pseudomallei]|uniref:aromatic ring-opening dioxygenase LigA n=1 Tax=Burkholderia pseudomallei TaxID=28450 RepID=UPI000B1657F4|nr:aromatic ring-opening dioxygenase LigA [Burkholderia pseudomallei]
MINDRAARRAMLEARRCARGIDTPRLSSTGKRIAIIAGLRDVRGARLNDDRRTRRARIGPGSGSDRAQKMGRPAAPAAAIASAARVGRRSPGAAPEETGRRLGGIADAGGPRGAASRRDADARDATSCAVPARRAPGAAPNSLMVMGGARARAARAAMR